MSGLVAEGDVLIGRVTDIAEFGAFILLPNMQTGMLHVSELDSGYVNSVHEYLTVNQYVRVLVLSISIDERPWRRGLIRYELTTMGIDQRIEDIEIPDVLKYPMNYNDGRLNPLPRNKYLT